MSPALLFFTVYLAATIAVGLWASRRSRGDEEDYFLAGRGLALDEELGQLEPGDESGARVEAVIRVGLEELCGQVDATAGGGDGLFAVTELV